MNENNYQIAAQPNDAAGVHINLSMDFTLLGLPLGGAAEKKGDGVELLVMPGQTGSGEPCSLDDMTDGINELFEQITNGSSFNITPEEITAKLARFLKNEVLDNVRFSVKQVFIHLIKPKESKIQFEYAFSIGADVKDNTPLSDFPGVKLQSITFGIWNTDNKKIIDKMGLIDISRQLDGDG